MTHGKIFLIQFCVRRVSRVFVVLFVLLLLWLQFATLIRVKIKHAHKALRKIFIKKKIKYVFKFNRTIGLIALRLFIIIANDNYYQKHVFIKTNVVQVSYEIAVVQVPMFNTSIKNNTIIVGNNQCGELNYFNVQYRYIFIEIHYYCLIGETKS